MTEKKKIVEVKVRTDKGNAVPMGIMNASQATKLSDGLDVVVSPLGWRGRYWRP